MGRRIWSTSIDSREGEELDQRSGVDYKIYTDLYDPKTNIYLGARLLKDLQLKFKNRFIEYVGVIMLQRELSSTGKRVALMVIILNSSNVFHTMKLENM